MRNSWIRNKYFSINFFFRFDTFWYCYIPLEIFKSADKLLFVFLYNKNFVGTFISLKILTLQCSGGRKIQNQLVFNQNWKNWHFRHPLTKNRQSTNREKDEMTAEQLKKDTQNRLETIFHVRTRLDDLAEHKRQCIIGKLLNFCF